MTNTHTAVKIPATFIDQLKYRAKAVAAAVGAVLFTAGIGLVSDPSTEKAIEAVVPAQWQPVVALVFGAIVTAVVHQVKNTPLPGA